MAVLQRGCVLIFLAFLSHGAFSQDGGQNDGEPDYNPEFMEVRNGGQNDGEPDYDPEFLRSFTEDLDGDDDFDLDEELRLIAGNQDDDDEDEVQVSESHPYLMLMPEDFDGSTDIHMRGGGSDDDMMTVPDDVWGAEKNYTKNHPSLRQAGNPPAQACIAIKVVYNSGWVSSAGGGNSAVAKQRAIDVITEAQNIYNNKFASSNRLQTAVTFNIVGAPVYATTGSWQATSSALQSSAVQNHVDRNSYSTQHYAFLAGSDNGGAIGIAYLGTPCFRNSNDQKYKISINEWYNNVADSAGVLAHEVGHALGMSHDFGSGGTSDTRYDSQGNRCTGLDGLMDYGSRSRVNKFSTCSKEDFATWYRRVVQTYGSFCLSCGTVTPTNPPTIPPNVTQPPTNQPPSGSCNGVPRTGWSCCSSSSPCNVGGGDCDRDSHCSGSLTCGRNNCRRDFSSTGSNWARSADCCVGTITATRPPIRTTVQPPSGSCNGVPSTDWRCCTFASPCNVGGGDCDLDSHCTGSLVCGLNNCRRDFSSTGSNWGSAADCCIVPSTATPPPTGQCNGVPNTGWSCCSSTNPCNVGGGDCDRDSHCAGTLTCGSNNCRRDFSTTGSNWSSMADCCVSPTATTPPTAGQCNGVPRTDWSCCSSGSPCNVGGGDCDRDSHCAGNLKCGRNNCKSDFSSTGSNWGGAADCCISSSTATTAGPNPTNPPATTAAPPNPNPPTTSCGIKPAAIVGGSEVTPYSLPWQVGLVRRGSNSPFCGGTLISDRHVLTAAHCTSSGSIDVIVGEHSITSTSDGTRHPVCRYVDHPNYGNLNNDFSILHLQTPVQIGTRAAPACLPSTSMGGNFLAGKTLTVSGWGALSEGGGSPTVLHKVDVPGMTNSQCGQSPNYNGGITSAMVCAGQASGGIDSCQGDSGGPLTYTTGGRTHVVGVVSWGQGCARPNKPGVYARVTEALTWITGQMSQTC